MNVILLVVDAMRYDMPWDGYDRPIAPNLTKLHAKSVAYERGYAISSFTSKSIGGLLSGRYPSSLARTSPFFTAYKAENEFMAEVLQKHGIRTLGAHAHMYLKSVAGFHQGFDVWEMVPGIQWDYNKDPFITSPDHTKVINQIHAAPENTSGQFFAYYHYMDPHDVYNTHDIAPDFGKKARDRYDQEVWFTDHHIQKMLDYVDQQAWGQRTAIIVTGDHGEAFGERNFWKHAFELYEVLVRVPLFIYVPGLEPRKVARWRGHIDLVPTIYDLMGVPIPDGLPGTSLLPELKGEEVPPRPIFSDLPADTYNVRKRVMIDEEGYKLSATGADRIFELFNVKEDPHESKNLIDVDKERAAAMIERYKKLSAGIPFKEAVGGPVKKF
jgi:choline-sulfatase